MSIFTPKLIEEITHRIVNELDPEEIILFGSYAWGTPNKDSDLDLFVIMPDGTPNFNRVELGVRARCSLHDLIINAGVDIWVITRSNVEKYRKVLGSLERKIVDSGKVLYARGKTPAVTSLDY